MFCTNCGARIADDAVFCTNCGAATTSDAAPAAVPGAAPTAVAAPASVAAPQVAPAPTPAPAAPMAATVPDGAQAGSSKKRSKAPLIIGIVIAVIAIAAVVAVVLLNPFAHSSGKSSDSASSASAAPSKPQLVSNDFLRIEMPASYVDEGLMWTLESSVATLRDGDDKTLAVLLCGMDALSGEAGQEALLQAFSLTEDNDDIHMDAFLIGSSEASLADEAVGLFVPYWDAEGNYIPSDSPNRSTLALASAGLTVDDLLSWISLNTSGTFVPATIVETVTSASEEAAPQAATEEPGSESASDLPAHGTSYNTAPFYGVWIGAFSTRDRAESFAAEAQGKNLPAEVYVSTEWTNLNPNTYYVVSIDHLKSEAAANELLAKVKAAGYDNAYVKYSGDHR